MTRQAVRKFAALDYDDADTFVSINLGDEIQTIAARRFLPQVDTYINRENLRNPPINEPHKIILNGWFMHRPENWPPSEMLDPLLISIHITNIDPVDDFWNWNSVSATQSMLSGASKEYFHKKGPVGARDTATLRLLQEAGVDAYFSGCVTLTLPARDPKIQQDIIYCVDVPDSVRKHIEFIAESDVAETTHFNQETDGTARFQLASELLERYSSARGVVTTRLHCALPCLAMGVPVLLLDTAADAYRFDGLRDLLRCALPHDVINGEFDGWLSQLPANGEQHLPIRDALVKRISDFIAGNEGS
ncbi:polysaccharide pyruvyl transferase family protein [Methylobacterium oxalidis]|uniref:polysaccharide pyruvyl transferase family protein n=1 Tax=Methylobacterium oxalidis TaxID=944322 RepID=UPI00331542B3